jgi:hypothetical protein
VPLGEFDHYVRSLLLALMAKGVAGEPLHALLNDAVRCRCVQCRVDMTSDDLLACPTPDLVDDVQHPKWSRLRLGYCARHKCPSRCYQITYMPHPAVEWDEVFTLTKVIAKKQRLEEKTPVKAVRLRLFTFTRALQLKLLAGIGLILALALVHQWRIGGRIPWIREPAKFTVNPAVMHAAGLCPLGTNCPYHAALGLTNAMDTNVADGVAP